MVIVSVVVGTCLIDNNSFVMVLSCVVLFVCFDLGFLGIESVVWPWPMCYNVFLLMVALSEGEGTTTSTTT